MKMALHGLKRLQRILCWSRADNVACLTTTLHIEQCTRFELAPESWQDPMQPLTPTLHYYIVEEKK